MRRIRHLRERECGSRAARGDEPARRQEHNPCRRLTCRAVPTASPTLRLARHRAHDTWPARPSTWLLWFANRWSLGRPRCERIAARNVDASTCPPRHSRQPTDTSAMPRLSARNVTQGVLVTTALGRARGSSYPAHAVQADCQHAVHSTARGATLARPLRTWSPHRHVWERTMRGRWLSANSPRALRSS